MVGVFTTRSSKLPLKRWVLIECFLFNMGGLYATFISDRKKANKYETERMVLNYGFPFIFIMCWSQKMLDEIQDKKTILIVSLLEINQSESFWSFYMTRWMDASKQKTHTFVGKEWGTYALLFTAPLKSSSHALTGLPCLNKWKWIHYLRKPKVDDHLVPPTYFSCVWKYALWNGLDRPWKKHDRKCWTKQSQALERKTQIFSNASLWML